MILVQKWQTTLGLMVYLWQNLARIEESINDPVDTQQSTKKERWEESENALQELGREL
jgi:hypothetical protein